MELASCFMYAAFLLLVLCVAISYTLYAYIYWRDDALDGNFPSACVRASGVITRVVFLALWLDNCSLGSAVSAALIK